MLLVYVLVLLLSAVLLAVSAVRGSGQSTGTRVLNGILAAVFLCYACYLALFFAGGTIYIAYWAFILPVVAVVRTIRAHRASKPVTRYEYPDIYAPPARQWGVAAHGLPLAGSPLAGSPLAGGVAQGSGGIAAGQRMPAAGQWGPATPFSPAGLTGVARQPTPAGQWGLAPSSLPSHSEMVQQPAPAGHTHPQPQPIHPAARWNPQTSGFPAGQGETAAVEPRAWEVPRPQQPQPWAVPEDSAHPWVEPGAFGQAAPSGLPGRHSPAAPPTTVDRPVEISDQRSAPQAGPVRPSALPQPTPREWPPAQVPGSPA